MLVHETLCMYEPRTYSFTHTHFRHLISHHKRKSQGFSNTTTLFPQPSSGVVLDQPRVAHHLRGVFPFGIRRQQFQLHALLTMWCGDRSPQVPVGPQSFIIVIFSCRSSQTQLKIQSSHNVSVSLIW